MLVRRGELQNCHVELDLPGGEQLRHVGQEHRHEIGSAFGHCLAEGGAVEERSGYHDLAIGLNDRGGAVGTSRDSGV
jgi:hypothetical protein